MREIRSYGSVRGATRESRPYRDLFLRRFTKVVESSIQSRRIASTREIFSFLCCHGLQR